MRSPGYDHRKPLVLTPLRQKFMESIRRLLYLYGTFEEGLCLQRLGRDGLEVFHNGSVLNVELDGLLVMNHSIEGNRRTTWCSNAKLQESMDKIDRIFLLDDLAGL